jgi:MFS family permease
MSEQKPTIDYRNPGTGDGSADPIVARMMQRHALTTAGAVGLLATGVGILLIAGAVVSSIICFVLISLTSRSFIGWWGWYFVFLLAMVPLLFWEERRSRGGYLADRVGDFSPMHSSRGEYEMQNFEASVAVYTDMLLWGPRAILKGFATLRGERPLEQSGRFHRAAAVIRKLLEKDNALLVGQLLAPGETVEQLRPTLRWLDDHDYVGLSADGKRVWLSTDARRHFSNLR